MSFGMGDLLRKSVHNADNLVGEDVAGRWRLREPRGAIVLYLQEARAANWQCLGAFA